MVLPHIEMDKDGLVTRLLHDRWLFSASDLELASAVTKMEDITTKQIVKAYFNDDTYQPVGEEPSISWDVLAPQLWDQAEEKPAVKSEIEADPSLVVRER